MSNIKDAILRISNGEGDSTDKTLVESLDDNTFNRLYSEIFDHNFEDRNFNLEDYYECENEEIVDQPKEVIQKPVELKDTFLSNKAYNFARNKALAKEVIRKKRVL